jgi:hypothetical protein
MTGTGGRNQQLHTPVPPVAVALRVDVEATGLGIGHMVTGT